MAMVLHPKDWYQAIMIRESRRKFNKKLIDQKLVGDLQEAINNWNNEIDGVRIAFVQKDPEAVFTGMIGSYGKIEDAPAYLAFIGDMNDDHVQEKMGYLGECAVLEATSKGLATCWVAGSFKPGTVAKHITIKDNEAVLAVTPVGYAHDKKTMAEKLLSGMASSHKRKPLDKLCTGLAIKDWVSWMRSALEAARLAPSAINRQPWKFYVEKQGITISLDSEQNKYKFSKRLDCGIAMLHLEVGALAAGVQGKWIYLPSPNVARFELNS